MFHRVKRLLACSLLVSCSAFANWEDKCDAVIINQSKAADWTFNIPHTNCNPCVIQHGTVKHIDYPSTAISEEVEITDPNGKMKKYFSSNLNSLAKVIASGSLHSTCPYVNHEREIYTGGVSLNEPASGSFVIEKEVW